MKDRFHRNQILRNRRNAATLICVLACLVIVSGLMFAMTRATLDARRESTYRRQVRQTEFLLEAGIDRACQQLAESADYQGETWDVGSAITRFDDAQIEINVQPQNDDKQKRSVVVTATLGGGDGPESNSLANRTRRTHQFDFQLTQSSTAE